MVAVEVADGTVQFQFATSPVAVTLCLANRTTYSVFAQDFKVLEGRRGQAPDLGTLAENQPVVMRVKRCRSSEVVKIRLEIVEGAAAASQRTARDPKGLRPST